LTHDTRQLLYILQEGFQYRLDEIPDSIKFHASRIILSVYEKVTNEDKKWAIEVAGILSDSKVNGKSTSKTLLYLLKNALYSTSYWLQDIASPN